MVGLRVPVRTGQEDAVCKWTSDCQELCEVTIDSKCLGTWTGEGQTKTKEEQHTGRGRRGDFNILIDSPV